MTKTVTAGIARATDNAAPEGAYCRTGGVSAGQDQPVLDITVVVVNFNGGHLLLSCLQSLFDQEGVIFDAFLVDNGSRDGSLERAKSLFPMLTIIQNASNPGYAVANNQAIRQATGRYTLLLNPDVLLRPGTLAAAVGAMDADITIGILGPRVLLPDGSLDRPCRRSFKTPSTYLYKMMGLSKAFPRHREFGRYYLSWLDERQTVDVDAVIGAFLLIRRDVIEQVGLLDERFFMYCEDEDWCYRVKKRGWRVRYAASIEVVHYKGSSSSKRPLRSSYEWHKAILQFHRKNIARQYNWPVNFCVYAGIALSLSLGLARSAFPSLAPRQCRNRHPKDG